MKNVGLSLMRSVAGVWLFYILALFNAPVSAIGAPANPMAKVVEFLGILSEQIEKEGKDDAATYVASTKYYRSEKEKGAPILKASKDKLAQLQSDIAEAQSGQDGKQQEYTDLANKLAKNSQELAAGKEARRKEKAAFEKNEDVYVESVHRLDRALTTMSKQMPEAAASAAASASLLSVAEKLKTTLTIGSDFSLSIAQQEILRSFMRSARTASFPAPSFLQHESRGPFGEWESPSPGLVTTLQELLGKVKKERDSARKVEREAKADFKEFAEAITTRLESGDKSLGEIRVAIAQLAEQSGKKKASMVDTKEIYEAQVVHMKEVELEFRDKTRGYKIRLGKRGDEAIAVHEAKRLLSSEIAQSYRKMQTVGILGNKSASFQQLSRKGEAAVRRKALHVLKLATTPGLALLVLKSTAHHKRGTDPFAKVKSMIKGMVQSLSEKQAEEATQASYCNEEMGKTAKRRKSKEETRQKLQSRLDAVSAELEEVTADLAAATKDLKDVQEAKAAAMKIRSNEKKMAELAVRQYNDAAMLLRRACKALSSYYGKKGSGGGDKAAKDRGGMVQGIIALLEIGIDDFETLAKDAKESDEVSEQDFKDMLKDSTVRIGVFKKDIEWKTGVKAELGVDLSSYKNDMKMNDKELVNIGSYLDKLKASCVIRGPSYAEKVAKRTADLESLKEVLSYLTSK